LFCVLAAASIGKPLKAQVDAPHLTDTLNMNYITGNRLQLNVFNLNFLKNNEYFGPMIHGYTFFGSHIKAALSFQPSRYARFEGGVFLRKDYGNDKFTEVVPVIRAKLSKNGYSIVMGTLEGPKSHRLLDPLYDPERTFSRFPENGLQGMIRKKRIWMDIWIDWVRQEYKGSPYQEEINAGTTWKIWALHTDKFKAGFNLQGVTSHKGGQIHSVSTPKETITNTATGMECVWQPKGEGNFSMTLSSDFLTYADASETGDRRWLGGHGYYTSLTVTTKPGFQFSASYWYGYKYVSVTGVTLYQSVSQLYGSYYEVDRQLLLLRLMYVKKISDDVTIDVRFEPYYDIGGDLGSFLEYSYSGLISFRHSFPLKERRNPSPQPMD
jgi:hypothetical protein